MTLLHPGWGFDCAQPVTSFMPKVVAWGGEFIGRYLWPDGKGMTTDEVQAIGQAGFKIVSFYEGRGDQPTAFSAEQGDTDAKRAGEYAATIGQPEGTDIFYAVDYDASPGDEVQNIEPYFEAIHKVQDGHYSTSSYGSGLVCGTTVAKGLARCTYLGAIGWRNGHAFLPHASVVQKPPSDPYNFGFEYDPAFAQVADYGQWFLVSGLVGGPTITTGPQSHPALGDTFNRLLRIGMVGDDVRVLQGALQIPVDGIFGLQTLGAVTALQKQKDLDPDGVVGPLTLAALFGAQA
jgi:peptidoglycan hydrolase-like protein with peptidoglycan-binding domain